MRLLALPLLVAAASAVAAPARPFNGPDFSGTYDCKGADSHEGPYTSVVTLKLVPSQSTGESGAYTFNMQAPGYGNYPGHAAADGLNMAIHFALTDPAPKDYGTGIVKFRRTRSGKWNFEKFYYEPEFKGGNHGTEACTQK